MLTGKVYVADTWLPSDHLVQPREFVIRQAVSWGSSYRPSEYIKAHPVDSSPKIMAISEFARTSSRPIQYFNAPAPGMRGTTDRRVRRTRPVKRLLFHRVVDLRILAFRNEGLPNYLLEEINDGLDDLLGSYQGVQLREPRRQAKNNSVTWAGPKKLLPWSRFDDE